MQAPATSTTQAKPTGVNGPPGASTGPQAGASAVGDGGDGGGARCEACGYSFAGRQMLARCPECGTSVLDMLRKRQRSDAIRFRSERMIWGWPLYDIIVHHGGDASGAEARGIFAAGPRATGVVAFGGLARGVVAMGGMAFGGFAMGGLSCGLVTATGGLAIGGIAFGGMAAGGMAMGGMAAALVPDGGLKFALGNLVGLAIDPKVGQAFRQNMAWLLMLAFALPTLGAVGMSILTSVLMRDRNAGADAK